MTFTVETIDIYILLIVSSGFYWQLVRWQFHLIVCLLFLDSFNKNAKRRLQAFLRVSNTGNSKGASYLVLSILNYTDGDAEFMCPCYFETQLNGFTFILFFSLYRGLLNSITLSTSLQHRAKPVKELFSATFSEVNAPTYEL